MTSSACVSCSDDEDVAPLSAKFADIYPLSNYDDTEVVANMNGIHSELNGGGENMALKDEVWTWLLRSNRNDIKWWSDILYSSVLKSANYKRLSLKSPQISSTSSSSSEADDEEADGESSGEPPGAPKEDVVLGSRNPRTEESKADSPPPSYPTQQVGLCFLFCHGPLFLSVFFINMSIIEYRIILFPIISEG